jgi:pyridoxal phosphate enzyme (YggS family)
MTDASDRLAAVTAGLARACRDAGRADRPLLVAISKTFDADAIRPLIASGQRHFGENRVQEAQGKWPELLAEATADSGGITLHLVGQLQSNKAADAVTLFDVIHSVDRPSLVTALAKAQTAAGKRPAYYLQVNIGDEDQKGGCAIADLPALLAQARDAGLNVVGLMCVPPANVEPAPYFALLAEHAKRLGLSGLSMGMSSDYETASLLGSTVVRVGSALFGSRG